MKPSVAPARWLSGLVVVLVLGCLAPQVTAETIRLYLDADQTGARSSSLSIERGIRTALSEVGNKLGGCDVEIVLKNHRGNSNRSKRNLQEFLDDKRALAVFAGLHSPPLLAHRDFINGNEILVLNPWAAAAPITRPSSSGNWIFRLSVDDSKAGHVIVRYAAHQDHRQRPALLLEETGWGKSNERTMTAACAELDIESAGIFWFNWGLGLNGARIQLRNLIATGADCVLLVANSPEAQTVAQAMASLPADQRLPIYSHWGLTGGSFPTVIDAGLRRKIDLVFLQTSFSFHQEPLSALGQEVLERARALFPDVKSAADIKSPTGFIHAYDLTRILIAAVERTGLTTNIVQDRRRLRDVLEQLDEPVVGLVKIYDRPFGPFDLDRAPDAHEALGREDLRMAEYADDNTIRLMTTKDTSSR